MKILDCTLRDGGYYTNWNFSEELVLDYLKTMSTIGVNYVELGLRQFLKDEYVGPFGYTSDSYLEDLELPAGPKYGVMIDAGTILKNDSLSIDESIQKLFQEQSRSKITLVRIAAHPQEVPLAENIVNSLHNLGYEVALNIMQVSTIDATYLAEICLNIGKWKIQPLALYFADSLGSMSVKDVESIYKIINSNWTGDIGFHAHNNMGLAMDNAEHCIDLGLKWVDATVTGMGRGAGNLSIEDFYLLTKSEDSETLNALYSLISKHFEPLKKKYEYGPNFLYRIAAQHSIHPTYIQKLLADPGVETDTRLDAIFKMKKLEQPNKFTKGSYIQCLTLPLNVDKKISPDMKYGEIENLFQGRDFLVVGSGPSIRGSAKILKKFALHNKLISISPNIQTEKVFHSDYLCVTFNNSVVSELEEYKNFEGNIIIPKSLYQNNKENFNNCVNISHYGNFLSDENFHDNNFFSSKNFYSGGYAIAAAIAMGANKIYLAGFDGYSSDDIRKKEIAELLSFLQDVHGTQNIISLTETQYSIKTLSVFGMLDASIF